MAYACKTSSARSIVGVIPYLPYSKQCKMRKRGCIVSKLLAKVRVPISIISNRTDHTHIYHISHMHLASLFFQMMCKSGLSHIITMDLHQKEIQGFFDCPVDNLRASPFLLQYIQEQIPDYRNSVIVARNPGSAKKATSYAERLRLGIAVIHGEQKESECDEEDGRYSPPLSKYVHCEFKSYFSILTILLMLSVAVLVQWMFRLVLACHTIRPKRNHQSMWSVMLAVVLLLWW